MRTNEFLTNHTKQLPTRRAYYHMQACGDNVLLCTGGKITTKSMVFFNRKEVNYAKLMYVVLATQIVFSFLFYQQVYNPFQSTDRVGGGLHLFINSMTLHLV